MSLLYPMVGGFTSCVAHRILILPLSLSLTMGSFVTIRLKLPDVHIFLRISSNSGNASINGPASRPYTCDQISRQCVADSDHYFLDARSTSTKSGLRAKLLGAQLTWRTYGNPITQILLKYFGSCRPIRPSRRCPAPSVSRTALICEC